ncbi:hypothetical protein N2152v2_008890 [Parachlorella kessleri]
MCDYNREDEGLIGCPPAGSLRDADFTSKNVTCMKCREQPAQVAYTLHIVHVDESAAWGLSPEQQAAALAAVRQAAEPYLAHGVEYHCVALGGLFGSQERDAGAQRQQLGELVQGVADATGREDLVAHLRTHRLLAAARELGCSKVARGDCATRLAAHIVAAASKGCGYGLPGDIQLVDARELGRRELTALCHHLSLAVVEPSPYPAAVERRSNNSSGSINALAAGFVETQLANNAGSVSNIVGTISKLQAFPWNDPAELHAKKADQRRKQQQLAVAGGEALSLQHAPTPTPPEAAAAAVGPCIELLCPLCLAPLADDELVPAVLAVEPRHSLAAAADAATPPAQASSIQVGARPQQQQHSSCSPPETDGQSQESTEVPSLSLACCWSCRTQILGAASGLAGAAQPASSRVWTLLPETVWGQMHRLAQAEHRAGGQESGTAQAVEGRRDGAPTGGGVDALRRQIAEYLLDDCEE